MLNVSSVQNTETEPWAAVALLTPMAGIYSEEMEGKERRSGLQV